MRKLQLLFWALSVFPVLAQNTIPNGGFEQWTTISFEELDNYVTESGRAQFLLGSTTAIKSSDSQNGNSSIRLETKSNGQDTLFGFFTSGDFDNSNGFPYSQQPDSVVGYYKSNVLAGDTALLLFRFSKLGNIFSFEIKTFVGVQNSWTRFAFPLNLPLVPDSMFIAAASSNAINEIGVQPGSWIMFDNLSFVGTGITQQILNGDFENWTMRSYENPDFWSTANVTSIIGGLYSATKTTDKHAGAYALRLETVKIFDDTIGIVTNGRFGNDSIVGGQPFSIVFDTLVGYYKYSPIGIDSAAIGLTFSKNGNGIGTFYQILTAQSTYAPFEVPFVLPQVPDTLRIDIASTIRENILGSTLFIDELGLKSIVTNLDKQTSFLIDFSLYPNPSQDYINFSLKTNSEVEIQIVDQLGRLYWVSKYGIGSIQQKINLENLKSGNYFIRITSNNEVTYKSFIKN